MSYAIAPALQQAVYQQLASDPHLTQLVGSAIYDAVPAGHVPELYVSLGAEDVRDQSDKTGHGAQHEFTVSVVTGSAGFQSAKVAAGAVSDALLKRGLSLERGRLVSISFIRAQARRVKDSTERRIDLRFRARVED
jgi:hypothetical protein